MIQVADRYVETFGTSSEAHPLTSTTALAVIISSYIVLVQVAAALRARWDVGTSQQRELVVQKAIRWHYLVNALVAGVVSLSLLREMTGVWSQMKGFSVRRHEVSMSW